MKVIAIRGKQSYLRILTSDGEFTGDGELLVNGFLLNSDSIVDADGNAIAPECLRELICATKEYVKEECEGFTVYFS